MTYPQRWVRPQMTEVKPEKVNTNILHWSRTVWPIWYNRSAKIRNPGTRIKPMRASKNTIKSIDQLLANQSGHPLTSQCHGFNFCDKKPKDSTQSLLKPTSISFIIQEKIHQQISLVKTLITNAVFVSPWAPQTQSLAEVHSPPRGWTKLEMTS